MNMKAIGQWLDRLTAWGFIVGLCCWSYSIFMVQVPASFPRLGGEEAHGDISGVLFVMFPYAIGITFSLAGEERLVRWSGAKVCWRMIIWLHTCLWFPTLLSYLMAWWHYDYDTDILKMELVKIASNLMMIIILLLYLSHVLKNGCPDK